MGSMRPGNNPSSRNNNAEANEAIRNFLDNLINTVPSEQYTMSEAQHPEQQQEQTQQMQAGQLQLQLLQPIPYQSQSPAQPQRPAQRQSHPPRQSQRQSQQQRASQRQSQPQRTQQRQSQPQRTQQRQSQPQRTQQRQSQPQRTQQRQSQPQRTQQRQSQPQRSSQPQWPSQPARPGQPQPPRWIAYDQSKAASTLVPQNSATMPRNMRNPQIHYVFPQTIDAKRKSCGCFKRSPDDLDELDPSDSHSGIYRYTAQSSGSESSLETIRRITDALDKVPKPITTTKPVQPIESTASDVATKLRRRSVPIVCSNKNVCSCDRESFMMDPTSTCKCRLSITSLPNKQKNCMPEDNYSLISRLPIPEAIAEPLVRNEREQTDFNYKAPHIDHDNCQKESECQEIICTQDPADDTEDFGDLQQLFKTDEEEDEELLAKGSTEYILFWEQSPEIKQTKALSPWEYKEIKGKRKEIKSFVPPYETECQTLHRLKKIAEERKQKEAEKKRVERRETNPKPTLGQSLRSFCPQAFKLDAILHSQPVAFEKRTFKKKKSSKSKARKTKVSQTSAEELIDLCPNDTLFYLRNQANPMVKEGARFIGCLPQSESMKIPSDLTNLSMRFNPLIAIKDTSNVSLYSFPMSGFL